MTDAGRERLCNACGDWWPLDLFCRNPRCERGYTCECKACRIERRHRKDQSIRQWGTWGERYAERLARAHGVRAAKRARYLMSARAERD